MPEDGLWRSESAYEYVEALDAAGLAWEFLRRNSEYREDFLRASTDTQLNPFSTAAFARKWGLPFCCRSSAQRTRSIGRLDPFGEPGHDSPFSRPKRNR